MRREYPRPELERKKWISLCGEWDFAFDFTNSHSSVYPHFNQRKNVTYEMCKEYTHKIVVPFVPECKLSGIGYTDYINACWYRRQISVSLKENERAILRFEAVFHTSRLYVNGKFVGEHRGGYTPFGFDVTDFLANGKGTIELHVSGDARNPLQPSGKQSLTQRPIGCFYERCTGIWSPVWLEIVPKTFIEKIRYRSDIPNSSVHVETEIIGRGSGTLCLTAYLKGKEIGKAECNFKGAGKVFCTVPLETLCLWEVGKGGLYDLCATLESEDGTDEITSYFGIRELELDKKGLKINGKRVFQRLVLDQGYYPDGMYTASDEKEFEKDILMSMRMGFNGARLHEKVFERRFLYYADKLGYLCWGEYPSWGFDYSRDDALAYYLPEWAEAVERDYNHPSIIGWCPMNENWDLLGRRQNDLFIAQMYDATKKLDPTRPVIDSSWNFHVKTDYYDVHDYSQGEEFARRFTAFEDGKIFENPRYIKDQPAYGGEPYFLSEYGGLKWPNDGNGWGYNGADKILSEEDFVERFAAFHRILYGNKRICAACYTQLYDVQQECNGLYYYDRGVKFSDETIEKIAEILRAETAYEKEE